jgi:TolB-like protein/cytochrome c-type biogenesis protein CcmH/NrfG
MIGRALGHYRITAAIGAGGMGEVWRATDTKLGRDVALKVLPAEMTSDPERIERFQREARALAALDHPGIVTVYSVEEVDGVHFLTMQLVDGQPLDRIIPSGGMPLERIVAIGAALAEALAVAHDKGIVHRDLKPANVMIAADGRVKVLDFGLAKIAEAGAEPEATVSHALTQQGAVMGTMPYMSPEQVSGRPVDHRTDVFALGVILYEMATGRRPFVATSSAELASEILRDAPPSVGDVRRDLPAGVGRVISRCLEKDRLRRFQTARDVGNELADLARPASASRLTGAADSGAARVQEGAWIAVLPFKTQVSDPELSAFADGLGEDVTTGLSRFSHLFVISRNSAMQYAGRSLDVRAVGRELGARFALEGNVRKTASTVRVSMKLLDAATGTHLWTETYDRDLAGADILAVQDDITDRVVATVADPYGVLVRSMAAAVRDRPVAELSAKELVLRVCAYWHQIRPDEHARLRAALEQKLEREPMHAEGWACLSRLYSNEHEFRLNPLPDSVERARTAARRAVEIDPTCQMGWEALAEASYFARDLGAFRNAAERAMALNPRNTSTAALMGVLISHSGEWERGCEITRGAMALNPHHPGWYRFPLFFDHYRKHEYQEALETTKQLNMPEDFWVHAVAAAASGRLGLKEEARAALASLRRLLPGYRHELRPTLGLWIVDAAVVEQVMEGLAEAEALVGDDSQVAPTSGTARADEGFWVAVLPFRHRGADPGAEPLAEGLTEDIVTGLSRFSYLRVIARSSTERYASESGDIRSVGRALGARYVLEGSIRQAGSTVRIAAQLVDTDSGAHLWADTYNRAFRPDGIFEVIDGVAPRIVSTVADMHGVLPHTMSEALRGRDPASLTPYEAVLRSFGYVARLTAEEHAEVRACLERTVERSPNDADCLAMLSFVFAEEHKHGFNVRPDPLGRALEAARRAVAAAPSGHLGYHVLAQALFFRRELQAFRGAAERAVALNPMDSGTIAFMGILMAYAGDWERGCELTERAMQLNPNHPGWYRFASFFDAYRKGNYQLALDIALQFNMPSYFYTHMAIAVAHGQLGNRKAAGRALDELLSYKPDFASEVRHELGKWYGEGEFLEIVLDGLRKAGLDIGSPQRDAQPSLPEPASAEISVAVLPFADMSAAKDQEYLCEGMAEEIMNALVRVAGMRVASRTSAFRAHREGMTLPALAGALSVGHVLEGSVRTSGSRMRVTAQLTDAASGYQLWSERYDRDAGDIFAIQDEIAAGVVDAVRERLTSGTHEVRPRGRVSNLEAYRLYLKGRHLRYTKNDQAGALRAFEEAVRLDPGQARAWSGLAEVQVLAAFYGLIPVAAAHARAKGALETAVGLEGETVDSLYVAGLIADAERRFEDSERALRAAVELAPDHVEATSHLGVLLSVLGRFGEAAAVLQHARSVDALAPYPYAISSLCLAVAREPAQALDLADQALTLDEENTLALWVRGQALVALGRLAEAVTLYERAVTPAHRGGMIHGMAGWAAAVAGDREGARAALDAIAARPSGSPALVAEAWIRAELGDLDGAWEVLDRAEREGQFMLLLAGLPGFDRLSADPRFAELLIRLGLPPERQAPASERSSRPRKGDTR